jgi:L-amino acid N-acyltransferase YncA
MPSQKHHEGFGVLASRISWAWFGWPWLVDLLYVAKELGYHHAVMGGVDSEQVDSICASEPVGSFKEVGFKQGRWLNAVWMQKIL